MWLIVERLATLGNAIVGLSVVASSLGVGVLVLVSIIQGIGRGYRAVFARRYIARMMREASRERRAR